MLARDPIAVIDHIPDVLAAREIRSLICGKSPSRPFQFPTLGDSPHSPSFVRFSRFVT